MNAALGLHPSVLAFGAFVILLVPPVLTLTLVTGAFGLAGGVLAGVLALLALCLIVTRIGRKLDDRPLGALASVLPSPLPEGAFPVYLAIRHRGALTGVDEGLACFVDGWLHVETLRSAFDVHARDGRGEWRGDGTFRVAFLDGQRLDLRLIHDRGLKPSGAHFYHAANLWISDAERPEGASILPPRGLHPSVHALWMAATALGALTLVFAPVLIATLLPKTGARPVEALWAVGALLFFRGAAVLARGEREDRAARFEQALPSA